MYDNKQFSQISEMVKLNIIDVHEARRLLQVDNFLEEPTATLTKDSEDKITERKCGCGNAMPQVPRSENDRYECRKCHRNYGANSSNDGWTLDGTAVRYRA